MNFSTKFHLFCGMFELWTSGIALHMASMGYRGWQIFLSLSIISGTLGIFLIIASTKTDRKVLL